MARVNDMVLKETVEAVLTSYEGVPVLKVTQEDGKVGYLAPFRGYCFQVSGSLEGVRDLGASTVVGLGNFLKSDLVRQPYPMSPYACNARTPIHGAFRDMADLALWRWAGRELSYYYFPQQMEDFLEATIAWLGRIVQVEAASRQP